MPPEPTMRVLSLSLLYVATLSVMFSAYAFALPPG
jgi:hypothetical protein